MPRAVVVTPPRRTAPKMLLLSRTTQLSKLNEEDWSYKMLVRPVLTARPPPERLNKDERICVFFCVLVPKHTRRHNHSLARTVVVALFLLPWSESHTLCSRSDRSRRWGRDAADEVTAAEAVADATYLQQVLSLPPLPPSFSPLWPGRIPPGCVLPPSWKNCFWWQILPTRWGRKME